MTQLPAHDYWRLVAGEEGQYNDLQFQALRDAGFAGSNSDMLNAWRGQTNFLPNSSLAGVDVDSNTLPTSWTGFVDLGGFGLTRTIVGVGLENTLPFIDLRVHGTTTGQVSGQIICLFLSASENPLATVGDTFTGSVYAKLVDGSFTVESPHLQVTYRNSGGGFVEVGQTPMGGSLSEERARFDCTATVTNATVTQADFALRISCVTDTEVDFTIRLAAPQLEKRSEASPPILT